MDVVLGEAAAFQPDLVFIREQNREIISDVVHGSPDLVAEVLSASTEKRDRGPKMETYARYGIEEYWLVDLGKQVIEIYRLDKKAKAYRLVETCRAADRATSPLLPALSVAVDRLFAD
jgi:Uma2 family endonuclease